MLKKVRDRSPLIGRAVGDQCTIWTITFQMEEKLLPVRKGRVVSQCESNQGRHVVRLALRRAVADGIPARIIYVIEFQRAQIALAQQFVVFGALIAVQIISKVFRPLDARKRASN